MKKRRVVVVGGGQMGRALVGGMIASNFLDVTSISVVEPDSLSQAWWAENHVKIVIWDDLAAAVKDADAVLLAVKPNVIETVANQLQQFAGSDKLVLSIAAGISLEQLCGYVGHSRVCRVMPNTPSLVGAGASAFCVADSVSEDDVAWIEKLLEGVGLVVRVTEPQMDGVTGLSGSGPAYVCLVIEALADGGVLAGLPRPLAMRLATQTVLGTAQMVAETGKHPGELKDAVCSPGGTTIGAIQALEDKGLRSALIAAVQASATRSKEM
ncbi:MAG: pyrroline-5-carboxylate reductase [Planctomycetota bacterium]